VPDASYFLLAPLRAALPAQLFARRKSSRDSFPAQPLAIDWDLFVTKRLLSLDTAATISNYPFKPEALALLGTETNSTGRPISKGYDD
jgi:hypothetical protein